MIPRPRSRTLAILLLLLFVCLLATEAPARSPRRRSARKAKPSAESARRPAAESTDPFERWTARARSASDRLGEQWTVDVEDLKTSRTVFAFNPNQRLVPASNRKVVTTALALECLGPDFQFQTVLGLDRKLEIDHAHYTGNLILRSNGDPTFGGSFLKTPANPFEMFDDWARALREKGVAYIHGDLVIDASAFGRDQDAYPGVWEPHHRNNAYAAVPSALTINQNVLQISIRPGEDSGDHGRVKVFPSSTGIQIVNETRTSSRGDSGVSGQFEEDMTTLRLTGRVDGDGGEETVVMPLARPLEYIAANMERALSRQGVRLTGGVRIELERPAGQDPTPLAEVLGTHQSPTLNRLLVTMVRQSDNFLAEQIWLASAARVAGSADRLTARRVEQQWLNRSGLGWIEPGWDGCGISRKDLISAQELALLTRYVFQSVYRDFLIQALPLSGEQGTLRNRSFARDEGRVRAKTGTLAGVSSLTGFIMDGNNEPRLVFSIIGNAPGNTNGRLSTRINELVKALIDALDNGRLPTASPEIPTPPASGQEDTPPTAAMPESIAPMSSAKQPALN